MAIEIDLNDDLALGLELLAKRHYGEATDYSIQRVIEDALEIRLFCLERLQGHGSETEEPIVNWVPDNTPASDHIKSEISNWLFERRRPR